jgi:hypothetical protein
MLPTPWVAWICHIHTIGGVGGSTTMVRMFVACLCCVLLSCLVIVTCRMKKVPEHNPTKIGLEALLCKPPRLAPQPTVHGTYMVRQEVCKLNAFTNYPNFCKNNSTHLLGILLPLPLNTKSMYVLYVWIASTFLLNLNQF